MTMLCDSPGVVTHGHALLPRMSVARAWHMPAIKELRNSCRPVTAAECGDKHTARAAGARMSSRHDAPSSAASCRETEAHRKEQDSTEYDKDHLNIEGPLELRRS